MDRPDEERRVISFKRLTLTDIKIEVPRLAKKKVLTEAFTSGGATPLPPPTPRTVFCPLNTGWHAFCHISLHKFKGQIPKTFHFHVALSWNSRAESCGVRMRRRGRIYSRGVVGEGG